MSHKTITYGVLPSREEFETAFAELTINCIRCKSECECEDAGTFSSRFEFCNDSRVGTRALTNSELWAELERARESWFNWWHAIGPPSWGEGGEEAGQWCSDVLGVLGFEWV